MTKRTDDMGHPIIPQKVYFLFADYGLDQVCETAKQARKEAKDLREMGCKVTTYVYPWAAEDRLIEREQLIEQRVYTNGRDRRARLQQRIDAITKELDT